MFDFRRRPSSKKQLSPVHLADAIRIREYVAKAGGYNGAFNDLQWGSALMEIAKSPVGPERTHAVVDYYVSRPANADPEVWTPLDFRQWFHRLESEARKKQLQLDVQSNPAVQTIVQQCEEFVPEAGHKNLPAAVSRTLAAMADVAAKLPALIEAQRPKVRPTPTTINPREEKHLTALLASEQRFGRYRDRTVVRWFRFLSPKWQNWKGWSGVLTQDVFSLTHPQFPAFWAEQVTEDGGVSKAERFVKEVQS